MPVNGQPVEKTEAECRTMPPTTPAMTHDYSSGWLTLAALLGPPPAAAPAAPPPAAGTRAAFGGRPAASAPPPQAPGTPNRNDPFAGIEGAQTFRRGNNMNPGTYIARVSSAEFKHGRQKDMVIIEVEILTSSYDVNDPTTHQCNKEGSRATVFVSMNDNFLSNMKEIILAVSGFDAQGQPRPENDTVTKAETDAFVSADQPFAGALVYLEARLIKTKAQTDFTRISWWPCPQHPDGSPDVDKLFRDVR